MKILRTGRVQLAREALEEAGLRILQIGDDFALGWISVDDLEGLAELRGVTSAEPA